MRFFLLGCLSLTFTTAWAQVPASDPSKFAQLGQELPTPNTYRTASGAPGESYWQQQADYDISVKLDDNKQYISASEVITYTNNSPHALTYLWVQLDQNLYKKDSDTYSTQTGKINEKISFEAMQGMVGHNWEGGYNITAVTDTKGKKLKHVINKTMMRVDLPQALKPKGAYSFKIDWNFNINDLDKVGGRGGFEHFAEDGNNLYEIAQWFPRMAVYDDVNGWQHKQFLGRGEFALPFGNYKVSITVPSDHIVAATGELQNASSVLTATQQKRWQQAQNTTKAPVLIVTQQEAEKAEKNKSTSNKTWVFAAKNVRDFAWASSRKFIWDAKMQKVGGKNILCMSYYPKEGNPLWGKYSTEVVAHTVKTYSRYTIDYPYPIAISVHGSVGGMEYPMIAFNGGRPEKDGTYSDRTKYGMISVIIHEVGHNFFPMIINSDERQWTWMDEGLNTFCQYLSEQEWQRDYPSHRGEPRYITNYMKSDKSTQVPIMTNSESVLQFGNNAYGKPATALNVLRETVMGRQLFDYAFKEYAHRWAFRHPAPADFFRTMEDASGTDLDWFWRGWFYTTDHCDISIEGVKLFKLDTQNPEIESKRKRKEKSANALSLSEQRNAKDIAQTLVESNPELKDFYNSYDPLTASTADMARYENFVNALTPAEKTLLDSTLHLYEVNLQNVGGLIMPVILQLTYADGSKEVKNIPAEIWRTNTKEVSKVLVAKQPITSIVLDPFQETADVDLSNNFYPHQLQPSRFQLYKEQQNPRSNPMQGASGDSKKREGGTK